MSINDKGQIAFIGDGAAGGFTETWLGRSIKKDLILVSSEGLGMKNIAPNMIKSTFANPAYAYLTDPSIATFLLNADARNPTRYFDKFSEITISAGLSKREYAGGVQINNNGEVLVRRIEQAEGPIFLMAYLLGNFVGPSFIAPDYVNKPYSFIEKWDANTLNTVTPVGQGFVPMFLLNDFSLALSGLTGMYGALSFAAAPILRSYWPDYYGLLSNPSFNNNGDTVFNAFLEGTWHPTASAGYYTALHSDGSTKPGAPTLFSQQQYDPALGVPRFWMADNGTVVRSYNQKIEILDKDLSVKTSIPEHFSSLGSNPRITDDGTVIAFYGVLSKEGAESNHETPGEGIFVYRVSDGAIKRIAGISGNGFLDQGEIWEDTNLNGQVDRGEDQGTFGRFDPESPVGVNAQKTGYTVAYIGFDNQKNKGLYSTNFGFSNDSSISVASASMSQARETQLLLPSLIVEQGAGITDLAIYDPVNTKGDIAFWIDTGDRDIAATANAVPSMEIDRWWATANDDPIEVNLYVSILEASVYTLDIDIQGLLDQQWDLTESARIIIDGDEDDSKPFSFDGRVYLGKLSQGRHQLKINGFKVPKQPVLEEISFALEKGGTEFDKLKAKFIADHPEPEINRNLIVQYAPILLFSQKPSGKEFAAAKLYDDPLDPEGYDWSSLLKRQLPNQNKPVRLGDAETIVNFNPDALKSQPTIFATLLEQNGETAISYFFHYANSNWEDFGGHNNHEGDWEGITIFLKGGEPDRISFNQHIEISKLLPFSPQADGGTTYRWDYLELDKQTNRPIVYVGLGGHASYAKKGQTSWVNPNNPIIDNIEFHDGEGSRQSPGVEYLPRVGDGYIDDLDYTTDANAQPWLLFSGQWGKDDDSPSGPAFQSLSIPLWKQPIKHGERWLDPWAFTDQFNIPLIAQDDEFSRGYQRSLAFYKGDFINNDNYDQIDEVWVIPSPTTELSGRIYYTGSQFLYEFPDCIVPASEAIIDNFDYLLLDSNLMKIYDQFTSILLDPSSSHRSKEYAFSFVHSRLNEAPPAWRDREEDFIGEVELKIEMPRLLVNDITVVEGFDQSALVTFTVDKPSPHQITVEYATISASATSELDFVTMTGTLVIPANTTSVNIEVPILADNLEEEDETFSIKLTHPCNAFLAKDEGVVTILDTKLSIENALVVERQGNSASLDVRVNKPSPKEVSVNYVTKPISASSGLDYSSQSGTLIIPANASSGSISIPILDDALIEDIEIFSIQLSNPVNAALVNDRGIVTIIDADKEDVIPVETINKKSLNVTTPKSSSQITIRSSSNPSPSNSPERTVFPVEFFDIDISQITPGGATSATLFLPQDSPTNAYWKYGPTPSNPNPHWYNFLYDPISKTGAVFQDLDGDGQNEIILHLVDGKRGDDDLVANGQIREPGAPAFSSSPPPIDPPVLALAASTIEIAEGNSGSTAYTFTVNRSGDTSGTSSATWTVMGSGTTPATGSDFVGGSFPIGTVSFAAGDISQTITAFVEGDMAVELDEGFTVTLSGPASAILDPVASSASATIRNDDAVLAIASASVDKAEGNSGTTAYTFSVTRNGDTSGDSTVTWTVSGSGTNPASATDFDGDTFPTGTVSFSAGETSQMVTVNVLGEKSVEPDESFTIALSAPTGAILEPSASTAAGTIRNDDQNQGPASYQISGTAGVGQKLTATRTASDPDGDGEPAFNWQTFTAGTWSPAGSGTTYTVAASDEGNQLRLQVTYTDAQGFLETVTTPSVTVPLLPTLAISASATTQQEGNIGSTPYAFTISRSGDLGGESRVSWIVVGSGANPANDLDFAGGQLPGGTAVFAAGQETASLTINVVGDASLEPDEGFRLHLHTPSGARLSSTSNTGLIQILNDDQPTPTYSYVATPETVHEGGTLHIGVSTTNVAAGQSLWWQLSGPGITASDFSDGLLAGSTLIGSDGRASFTKTVATDAVVDSDEQLEVRFFSDAARTRAVGSSLSVILKEPSEGVVTDGNDIITGTAAAETITGVSNVSALRGRGSLDRLTGGGGADRFLLGDAQGLYYNDGTTGLGTADLALITDFTSDDRIQLHGNSTAYRLISGRHGGNPGVRIDALATTPENTPEAIGFVQGTTLASLNLANPNQFLYV